MEVHTWSLIHNDYTKHRYTIKMLVIGWDVYLKLLRNPIITSLKLRSLFKSQIFVKLKNRHLHFLWVCVNSIINKNSNINKHSHYHRSRQVCFSPRHLPDIPTSPTLLHCHQKMSTGLFETYQTSRRVVCSSLRWGWRPHQPQCEVPVCTSAWQTSWMTPNGTPSDAPQQIHRRLEEKTMYS